jgi:hypothetical protein
MLEGTRVAPDSLASVLGGGAGGGPFVEEWPLSGATGQMPCV